MPIRQERNVLGTPKLVGRLHMLRSIMRTSFIVKRSRSRPINNETESVSYLWNGKAYIRNTRVKVLLREFHFLKPVPWHIQRARGTVNELEYLLPYFPPGKHEKIANGECCFG